MRSINKNVSIVIKKWSPIVENHLRYKNPIINNLICQFCEWYTSDIENSDYNSLPNELMNIKDRIDSFERIEVLGKYFNPASGHIEYKLKSGEFIKVKDSDYELSDENLIKVFGIEFIRDLDPQKFRDNQIDKLI